MARKTAAAFEELFAVSGVATLLFRQFDGKTVLPQIRRDRLDLLRAVFVAHVVLAAGGSETPERRHLRAGTEALRVLEPNRNPFLAQLFADVFQVWTNLLLVLHQELRLQPQLIDPRREKTVRHAQ